MYRLDEDGAAVVYQLPVTPFVPVQHMQMDITSVNRLAVFGLSFARENGWLQSQEDLTASTRYAASNDANPLIEQEGYAPPGRDETFFYAGTESVLADATPHFHYPPTPSTLLMWAKFIITHVGNSSYSILGAIYTYVVGDLDHKTLFGTFKVTTVCVSKSLRRPVPIEATRKQSLIAACEASAAFRDELAAHMHLTIARLDRDKYTPVGDCLCEMVPSDTFVLPPLPTVVAPLSAAEDHLAPSMGSLCFQHGCHYELRGVDIDFNHHLNQLVTMQLLVNTFRSATTTESCAFSRLMAPQLAIDCMRGDLFVRELRIDYIREIPMSHAATEMIVFVSDPKSRDAFVRRFRAGAPIGEVVEVRFLTLGVPKEEGPKFVATIGVLRVGV